MTTTISCLVPGAQPSLIPAENVAVTGSPVARGFYCPNCTLSDKFLFMCPPTEECLRMRQDLSTFCPPQGTNDVAICAPGWYCPRFNQTEICPEKHFCPVGCTAPVACSVFSSCPRGSSRELFLGSIFALAIILFIVLPIVAIFVRRNVARFDGGKHWATSAAAAAASPTGADKQASAAMTAGSTLTTSLSIDVAGSPKLQESMRVIGEALKRRREAAFGPPSSSSSDNSGSVSIRFENISVDIEAQEDEDAQSPTLSQQQQQQSLNLSTTSFSDTNSDEASGSEMDADENEAGRNPLRPRSSTSRSSSSSKTIKKLLKRRHAIAEAAKKQHHQHQQQEATTPTTVVSSSPLAEAPPAPPTAGAVKHGSHLRRILQPCSGEIKGGRMLLVIGSSGSSKTTLVKTLLRQNDPNHIVGGKVIVSDGGANQKKEEGLDVDAARRLLALVPQYDTVHYDMSVMANIYFSSEIRLPSSWSHALKTEYRHAVLDALQLLPYAERLVGAPAEFQDEAGSSSSGSGGQLSGGQRRRVSIALELAAAPLALFADEPTSGLDSTVAYRVCSLLASVTHATSIPCICVLHQPRVEIFQLFDDLLLMAPGGRIAYHGPRGRAVDFFTEVGVLTAKTGSGARNPADLLLDLVTEFPRECVVAWAEHGEGFFFSSAARKEDDAAEVRKNETTPPRPTAVAPTASASRNSEPDAEVEEIAIQEEEDEEEDAPEKSSSSSALAHEQQQENHHAPDEEAIVPHDDDQLQQQQHQEEFSHDDDRISFLYEMWLMVQRKTLKYANDPRIVVFDICMSAVVSAVVTTSVLKVWGAPLAGRYVLLTAKFRNELVLMYGMMIFIAASTVGPSSVRVFGTELPQLLREFRSGYRVWPLFAGYFLVELTRTLIMSLVFATVAFLMWRPTQQFYQLWGVCLVAFWTFLFVGAIVGTLVPISNSRLIAMIVCVLLAVTNGFPSLPGVYLVTIPYWATVLLQKKELDPSKHVMSWAAVRDIFDQYPEELDDRTEALAIGIISLELVVFAGLSFLALWWVSRK